MKFLKRLITKERFPDGSTLWPSGREHFSFVDQHGDRFEFDVLYTSEAANASNLIVSSSFVAADGRPISEKAKEEIISRAKVYFFERGEEVGVI